ncbi:17188_t:CDS:2 [Gigaspora rosea]|nr:17188_t:CDS:2 [Gigaspora rosea]
MDWHLNETTLNLVSDKIASYVVNQAKTSEYGVTVAFDEWTNIVNQCFIGSVLVTNNGELLIWDVVDVSGHRKKMEEIMEYTEKIFNDIKKDQIVVIALVTDSAATYAASQYL